MNNPIISLNLANLDSAMLKGADLRDVDLQGAIMSNADLRDADLRGADMRGTNLQNAILRSTNLCDVDMRGADLEGANVQGADLQGANLRGAILKGSDFQNAILKGADLKGADLTEAIMPDGEKYRPTIHGVEYLMRKIIRIKNPKFIIFTGKDGQFYFRLVARNGAVILASEGYPSKSGCINGIASVKKNAKKISQYKPLTASNGQFYFNLIAGNNQVIGKSETYKSEQGRENIIEMVKATAPDSLVEDVA